MPRHVLLLIAALALLLGAATAQAAPASATAPAAHAAQDDDALGDFEGCAPDDDACLDEEWTDEELACDDEWVGEDEVVAEDEEVLVEDETLAEVAATGDDCGDDAAEPVAAPELTALTTTVAGEGARLNVTIGFRLDEPGRVELTLARVPGAATSRRAAAACTRSAAARRSGRGKACPRTLPGKVVVVGRAGANTHQLRGTWRGRRLAPGSYRLTATPKAPGATSDTVSFKVAPK